MNNVIILNDFAHINGGAARVAISSALGLADAGRHVVFFSCVPPVDPRLEDHPKIHVVCTEHKDILQERNRWRAAVRGAWNTEAAKMLRNVLLEFDPAATPVHAHCFSKALTAASLSAVRDSGFPLVVTLHDYFPVCPNGGLHHYGRDAPCTHKAMSPGCLLAHCDARSQTHKVWRLFRHAVQSRTLRHAGPVHWVFVSEYSRRLMQDKLPAHGEQTVIFNPVDVKKQTPAAPGASSGFVCVGDISRRKGVFLLARATKKAGIQVVYVGDGPERGELERAYPHVQVTGWLDPESVAEYVRGSRALVFPSLWREAQPLAPLEAMALGVAPVVSEACAAAEYVTHEKDGLIVSVSDEHDLANALTRLQNDNELARKLGKSAFETFWSKPPTLERHVAELEKLYAQVLATK